MASLGSFIKNAISAASDVFSSKGTKSNTFKYNVSPYQLLKDFEPGGGSGGGNNNGRFRRPRNFRWRPEALNAIDRRIKERLFERGLNSDDAQMRPAQNKSDRRPVDGYRPEAITTFRYRYKTGTLANSLRVTSQGSKGNLTIKWSRDADIINRLTNVYGQFLAPSPSDISYILWLYLRENNLIAQNAAAPGIRPDGRAPYNPRALRRR